jgi:hypothetical protein
LPATKPEPTWENLVGATGFEPVTLPVWLGLPEISLAELIGGTSLREDRLGSALARRAACSVLRSGVVARAFGGGPRHFCPRPVGQPMPSAMMAI